jgi:hypothetical protein
LQAARLFCALPTLSVAAQVIHYSDSPANGAEIIDRIAGADCLLSRETRIRAEALRATAGLVYVGMRCSLSGHGQSKQTTDPGPLSVLCTWSA